MSVLLKHTVVAVRDKRESARFVAEILGPDDRTPFGPFLVVQVDNDVSLDFADEILGRIRARGLPYRADPGRRRPGEINTNDGGRGVRWDEPSGRFLEIITRPHGSGP